MDLEDSNLSPKKADKNGKQLLWLFVFFTALNLPAAIGSNVFKIEASRLF